VAAAEASLRAGRADEAAKKYREAIGEGWLLLGTIDRVEERLLEAENAFRAAAAEGSAGAREALAFLLVQRGESAEAVEILRDLTARDAKNVWTRRLLAQALMASGQPDGAVKVLEEARSLAPADLEVAFALADAYLARRKWSPPPVFSRRSSKPAPSPRRTS
jgi:tetratricopeptide (TPR) repeat protein